MRPSAAPVCNRFDCRDRSSGRLYERLAARCGGRVFDTIIHRDDQIEAYAGRGMPVAAGFAHKYGSVPGMWYWIGDEPQHNVSVTVFMGKAVAAGASGADSYARLADEVLAKL